MTQAGYTHITLLVDRSGSMGAILDDAQGGLDSFIKEQKAVPGKATITLYQFDSAATANRAVSVWHPARRADPDKGYEKVYGPLDIRDAPSFTLHPRGSTALLDAVGYTVNEVGVWLAGLDESERPEHVIYAILTDGQENASHEYTVQEVRDILAHQKDKYNWNVIYLSTDLRAVRDAKTQYGFDQGTYAVGQTMRDAYASASAGITATRTLGGRTKVN